MKLTKKQEAAIGQLAKNITDALEAAEEIGDIPEEADREFGIVYQKLEEAEMWLDRGLENLGFPSGDEGGEDGDDDGDEEDEEEGADEDEEDEEHEEKSQ